MSALHLLTVGGVGVLLGCEGDLYSLCTEMPSTAHAPGLLSTPLAREHICQWCGKAHPPLTVHCGKRAYLPEVWEGSASAGD